MKKLCFLISLLISSSSYSATQLQGGDVEDSQTKPKGISLSTETLRSTEGSIKFVDKELLFRSANEEVLKEYVHESEDNLAEVLKRMQARGFTLSETKELRTPRLQFYGKAGKVIKEMPIIRWERKTKKAENSAAAGEGREAFQQIEESAEISPDGKYAFVNTRKKEGVLTHMEGVAPASEWKMFDGDGKQMWGRKTDDVAMRGAMSTAGTLAVIIGGSKEGGGNERLVVFDKSGVLTFSYPAEGDAVNNIFTDMLKSSPNGRYLATRVGFKDGDIATVFFDLKVKKAWKSEHDYVIYEMRNNGNVKCDYFNDTLGKPSLTEILDIKSQLGE